MRMHKLSINSDYVASTSSSSSSFHSSVTVHSIASSTDSSSSPSRPYLRCEGLDLLVKAIHHVSAGSAVGFPYIQRRVIRRRRRAVRFDQFIVTPFFSEERAMELSSAVKRNRRLMALPSKYQDSVLQPLKPRSRRRRSVFLVLKEVSSADASKLLMH